MFVIIIIIIIGSNSGLLYQLYNMGLMEELCLHIGHCRTNFLIKEYFLKSYFMFHDLTVSLESFLYTPRKGRF